MALAELLQKSGSTRKRVAIHSNHLKVHTKSLQEDLEYQIKFEDLGFETIKKTVKTANLPFYAFLAFTLMNVYLLITSVIEHSPVSEKVIWVVGTAFFGILALYCFTLRNQAVIYLTGGQKALELMAAKPSEQAVLNFIDQIHAAMRAFYKEKYTQFDSDTSYEMKMGSLRWLKEMGAITEEEFASLSSAYKTEGIIGFKKK